MEFKIDVNGETTSVDAVQADKGRMTARIEDSDYEAEFMQLDTHWLHMRINGQSKNIYVNPKDGQKTIIINGTPYTARDADQLEMSGSRKKGRSKGATSVTPPMPAVVISVDVAEGDRVEKRQPVVVVSAMKMETILTAPYDGFVEKVNVAEGSKVMPGDILVDIAPLESGGTKAGQGE